jgi:hypothetical protein
MLKKRSYETKAKKKKIENKALKMGDQGTKDSHEH